MYTGIEQLRKWMVDSGSQVSPCEVGGYQQAKGEDQNDPGSNRLELEISAWIHVQLKIDTNGHL